MSSRYRKRNILVNSDPSYNEQLKNRGVKAIEHFDTPQFSYPKASDLEGVTIQTENYKVGDRYYKFAQKYYGDPNYWWVIAHYNQKPTENLYDIGDIVYIPTPLTKVLEAFEN